MSDPTLERAQAAEARAQTYQDQIATVQERHRLLCETFGIAQTYGGHYRIDYQKLAEALGFEQALELRRIIDETYQISGEPGEKPRVKVSG